MCVYASALFTRPNALDRLQAVDGAATNERAKNGRPLRLALIKFTHARASAMKSRRHFALSAGKISCDDMEASASTTVFVYKYAFWEKFRPRVTDLAQGITKRMAHTQGLKKCGVSNCFRAQEKSLSVRLFCDATRVYKSQTMRDA